MDGLDKFAQAVEKYGVDGLFADVLPEGTHNIDVSIDPTLPDNVEMRTPNASTMLVNPAHLGKNPLNVVASGIGHELTHVNDHLRGALYLRSNSSIRASEVRGYRWQFENARHFELNRDYKMWLMNKVREFR